MGCCSSNEANTEEEEKHKQPNADEIQGTDQPKLSGAEGINSYNWLDSLVPEALKQSDMEDHNDPVVARLVPSSNRVDNLEDRLKYVKTLGTGATCRVILAVDRGGNLNSPVSGSVNYKHNSGKIEKRQNSILESKLSKYFALKQMRKDDTDNLNAFSREADLLSHLQHPNIVQLEGCYIDKYNYYIATQYCTGGALLDFIVECKYFSEQQASYYLKTILSAIDYCHSKNIVHRDLKPGNIMFDKLPILNDNFGIIQRTETMNSENEIDFSNGDSNNDNSDDIPLFMNDAKLVIIDFGEAIEIEDNKIYDEMIGTLLFMPPEIMRSRKGWELKAGDMWAVGVIAYVLVCGKPPFELKTSEKSNKKSDTIEETLKNIGLQSIKWPDPKDGKNTIKVSNRCKEFISGLLSKTPKSRTTAKQALRHPWIMDNKNNPNDNTKAANNQLLSNLVSFHDADVLEKILVHHVIEEMTEDDKQLLIRGFRTLDLDGDGVVTRQEIYQHLLNRGLTESDAKKKTRSMMKMMDPDRKGKISLNDYVKSRTLSTLANHFGSKSEVKLKGLELLDPENKGQIDSKMLEQKLSKVTTQEEQQQYMQSIHNKIDSKGTITYQIGPTNFKLVSVNNMIPEDAEHDMMGNHHAQMSSQVSALDSSIMGSVNLLSPRSVASDGSNSPNTTNNKNNNNAGTTVDPQRLVASVSNDFIASQPGLGGQSTQTASVSVSHMDALASYLADDYIDNKEDTHSEHSKTHSKTQTASKKM